MRRCSLIVLLLVSLARTGPAQTSYFYHNYDYGSEALFNPVTFIINGGYDVTQLQSVPNTVGGQPYAKMARVVFRNLGSPLKSISEYGWGKFLRGEILPLEWNKGEMQWTLTYDEIDIVLEGELVITRGNEQVRGKTGDVIYIPKGSSITFGTPNWTRFVYVVFPVNWNEK